MDWGQGSAGEVFEGRAIRLSDTRLIGLSILKKSDCAFGKRKDPDFFGYFRLLLLVVITAYPFGTEKVLSKWMY